MAHLSKTAMKAREIIRDSLDLYTVYMYDLAALQRGEGKKILLFKKRKTIKEGLDLFYKIIREKKVDRHLKLVLEKIVEDGLETLITFRHDEGIIEWRPLV